MRAGQEGDVDFSPARGVAAVVAARSLLYAQAAGLLKVVDAHAGGAVVSLDSDLAAALQRVCIFPQSWKGVGVQSAEIRDLKTAPVGAAKTILQANSARTVPLVMDNFVDKVALSNVKVVLCKSGRRLVLPSMKDVQAGGNPEF